MHDWRAMDDTRIPPPKDTAVLLWCESSYEIGHYNTGLGAWVDCWNHRPLKPTHWQWLPPTPTGEDWFPLRSQNGNT